jgi:hypothetical protein
VSLSLSNQTGISSFISPFFVCWNEVLVLEVWIKTLEWGGFLLYMQRNGYEEETRVNASGKWELMKFSADLFREVNVDWRQGPGCFLGWFSVSIFTLCLRHFKTILGSWFSMNWEFVDKITDIYIYIYGGLLGETEFSHTMIPCHLHLQYVCQLRNKCSTKQKAYLVKSSAEPHLRLRTTFPHKHRYRTPETLNWTFQVSKLYQVKSRYSLVQCC